MLIMLLVIILKLKLISFILKIDYILVSISIYIIFCILPAYEINNLIWCTVYSYRIINFVQNIITLYLIKLFFFFK